MVGIVVVSHSNALAEATISLAHDYLVKGQTPPKIVVASGFFKNASSADALEILEAITEADTGNGVVILVDLGATLTSAELALEMLSREQRERVVLSPAPLVEGVVAAVVAAASGAPLDRVAAEALESAAGKDLQMRDWEEVDLTTQKASRTSHPKSLEIVYSFTVSFEHGLSGKAAASLVASLRQVNATVTLKNLSSGAGPILASGVSQIAVLDAQKGHHIEAIATGPAATEAIGLIKDFVAESSRTDPDLLSPKLEPIIDTDTNQRNVQAIAVGPVRHLQGGTPEIPEEEYVVGQSSPSLQWQRLTEAIEQARTDLDVVQRDLGATGKSKKVNSVESQIALLDDQEILKRAHNYIDPVSSGDSSATALRAPVAWSKAIAEILAGFDNVHDDYLQLRLADIRSIGDQVLRNLLGLEETSVAAVGILVADDLMPSEAAQLDPDVVKGVVLASGSNTSHAAILIASQGIPLVAAAGAEMLSIPEGTLVILDGTRSEVIVDPSPEILEEFTDISRSLQRVLVEENEAARNAALTREGVLVQVQANITSLQDTRLEPVNYADGAGLVRTEFLFGDIQKAPSRKVQERIYRAIAKSFDGKRIVIRTLDKGGDKPESAESGVHEENPFLGVRGLRLQLARKHLLLDQLAAICQVAKDYPVSVVFPMVSTVGELQEALDVLEQAIEATGGRRPESLKTGIVIEIPAAALKASTFEPYVDFLTVGTNDLTQYTMAVERGNPALTRLADALDPGILMLIRHLRQNTSPDLPITVCGEMAADPVAVPILLGLGVNALSVSTPAIARVKQVVRQIELSSARDLAKQVLTLGSAEKVRKVGQEYLRHAEQNAAEWQKSQSM